MKARIERGPSGRNPVRGACARPCAIERGMRILGGMWAGSFLLHLQDRPVRCNDLVCLPALFHKRDGR